MPEKRAFATSSAVPMLPMGMDAEIFSFTLSGKHVRHIGFDKSGAMALTVIPLDASSFAADFVRPMIPALDASHNWPVPHFHEAYHR